MNANTLLEFLNASALRLMTVLPVAVIVILGGVLLHLAVSRSITLLARRRHLSEADILPVRKIFRWVIIVATFILLLSAVGFNLGGIWAMLSTILAMIAIGFVAVWSMLSNMTATVLILLMRPFNIGDEVELPTENIKGRVVDLNFFFTILKVDENKTHQVPNNLFFQKVTTRVRNSSGIPLAVQLENDTQADLPAIPTTPETVPPVSPARS